MTAALPADERTREALVWIAWAEGDLLTARRLNSDPDIPPRQAAQHAEQAVEKAVKAGLILRGINFGREHRIETLAERLGWPLGVSEDELERLSVYNTDARYPDSGGEAPTVVEAGDAVAVAERVVRAVRQRLATLGIATDHIAPR